MRVGVYGRVFLDFCDSGGGRSGCEGGRKNGNYGNCGNYGIYGRMAPMKWPEGGCEVAKRMFDSEDVKSAAELPCEEPLTG